MAAKGKQKTRAATVKAINLNVDRALWEEFLSLRPALEARIGEGVRVRVSATAMLELAVREFIERHKAES